MLSSVKTQKSIAKLFFALVGNTPKMFKLPLRYIHISIKIKSLNNKTSLHHTDTSCTSEVPSLADAVLGDQSRHGCVQDIIYWIRSSGC